jgi:acyl carrier protein
MSALGSHRGRMNPANTTNMNTELSDRDGEIVCDLVAKELGVERSQVSVDSNLDEDFNPDSLTKMEIAMKIEERFDVSLPDEQMEKVVTVRDLCEVVAQALALTNRRP